MRTTIHMILVHSLLLVYLLFTTRLPALRAFAAALAQSRARSARHSLLLVYILCTTSVPAPRAFAAALGAGAQCSARSARQPPVTRTDSIRQHTSAYVSIRRHTLATSLSVVHVALVNHLSHAQMVSI